MGGSMGRIIAPLYVGLFLNKCMGCGSDPPECYDIDSDGDFHGEYHTNWIFFTSGVMTCIASVALIVFQYVLWKYGGNVHRLINARGKSYVSRRDRK
jgi:hypothetical protein